MNPQVKKAAPIILVFALAALVFIIRQCKDEQRHAMITQKERVLQQLIVTRALTVASHILNTANMQSAECSAEEFRRLKWKR